VTDRLTWEHLAYGDAHLYAFPCKFGWNVPGAETSTQLYALDANLFAGPGVADPRWQTPPRTLERVVENVIGRPEGMRAVTVVITNEALPDAVLERCREAAAEAVLKVLAEHEHTRESR